MTRPEERELEALMQRLAAGDRTAFDPLYDALSPLVRRLAERMTLDASDAEDAAQEAMLKVFARASQFDPERSLRPWVLAITAYECKTVRQRLRRRREREQPLEQQAADSATPEAHAIEHELLEAAREVLGTLNTADIDALQAMLSGERPDIPQATFRKRLERALRRLRSAWSSRHGHS